MTAEIAILNKQAVTLAADSAVTFRTGKGQKIFTSANKIFQLTSNGAVGVMVYGNASFLGVPWETIIKTYNKEIGKREFNSLKDYSSNFIQFLRNNRELFPASEQKKYINGNIEGYFTYLRDKILKKIEEVLQQEEGRRLRDVDLQKIIESEITKEYKSWESSSFVPLGTMGQVLRFGKKYQKIITKTRKEVFEQLPMSSLVCRKLEKIANFIFFKSNNNVLNNSNTGLVVAGFGKKDIFPCLHSYNIEGIGENFLKYTEGVTSKINFQMGAAVHPFAQKEMVVRFVEGIDPTLGRFIEQGLMEFASRYPSNICKKLHKIKQGDAQKIYTQTALIIQELIKRFNEYRRRQFVDPILEVAGMLPMDELAIMAETLVTLTSFKRRVSMDEETVAGPIDVVVISKGDGFMWAKRKENFRNI